MKFRKKAARCAAKKTISKRTQLLKPFVRNLFLRTVIGGLKEIGGGEMCARTSLNFWAQVHGIMRDSVLKYKSGTKNCSL